MPDMDRPRSEGHRGDVDDLDGVDTELNPWQLRRLVELTGVCPDCPARDPYGDGQGTR